MTAIERRNRSVNWTAFVILSACFLIGATKTQAQITQPSDSALAEMDRGILDYQAESNLPGGLLAVVSRGELVHMKAYGLVNVELSVPVKDSTVFEIDSISKQFTGAAAMLLVLEDKLILVATIDRYLPGLPSEWLGVTVRHLLTHTSAIPDYEGIGTYDLYRLRLTPEEIIRIAHSRPMDFVLGTGWFYSNTGYFLLSRVFERIEDMSLGQVLESRIFNPLEMTQTRMTDPEAIIAHRASGYWIKKPVS